MMKVSGQGVPAAYRLATKSTLYPRHEVNKQALLRGLRLGQTYYHLRDGAVERGRGQEEDEKMREREREAEG